MKGVCHQLQAVTQALHNCIKFALAKELIVKVAAKADSPLTDKKLRTWSAVRKYIQGALAKAHGLDVVGGQDDQDENVECEEAMDKMSPRLSSLVDDKVLQKFEKHFQENTIVIVTDHDCGGNRDDSEKAGKASAASSKESDSKPSDFAEIASTYVEKFGKVKTKHVAYVRTASALQRSMKRCGEKTDPGEMSIQEQVKHLVQLCADAIFANFDSVLVSSIALSRRNARRNTNNITEWSMTL